MWWNGAIILSLSSLRALYLEISVKDSNYIDNCVVLFHIFCRMCFENCIFVRENGGEREVRCDSFFLSRPVSDVIQH